MSRTAPDISLASSAHRSNLLLSQEQRSRLEPITGAQLVNPVKAKLIRGFDANSISAWSPIIWETINRIPQATRKRAFRHSTIDRIDNYEVLEWLGDKFIRAAVAQVIYRHHGDKHQAFQNVLYERCQKGTMMNSICRSLKMDEHIDIDRRGGLSDGVCEDVFEAVAAAIELELGHDSLLIYVEAIYKPVLDFLREQLEGDFRESEYRT
jgi:dsRNA-specific ribonuclease